MMRLAVVVGVLVMVLAPMPLPGQAVEVETPDPPVAREPVGTRVYRSDFAAGIDRAWSIRRRDYTPAGRIPFLGPLAGDTVSLALPDLPPHRALRLTFDLFIISTWDGNARHAWGTGRVGPDLWMLELDGGPTLLRGTFSAIPEAPGFKPQCNVQTWPWPVPGRPLPMGSGAAGVNTLGFIHTFTNGPSFPMDGRYAISIIIPHSQREVRFNFAGVGLQGGGDEMWGLADVQVDALESIEPPTPQQLAQAWQEVAGDDPIAAFTAFWTLILGDQDTVELIGREMQGFQVDLPAARAAIRRLKTTGQDQERERALFEISGHGPAIEPLLRAELAGNDATRWLFDDALREIEIREIHSPLRRQAAAASRVLQVINSDNARALHQRLLEAAPANPPPGTPAYEAGWRERFDRIYSLPPGQSLKFIPHPPAPERERFLMEYRRRQKDPQRDRWIDLNPSRALRFVILHSEVVPDYMTRFEPAPAGGLPALLAGLGLGSPIGSDQRSPIVGADAFADLNLRGDWIVRSDAGQVELLADLETILHEQTGRSIRFEPAMVSIPAVRISGTYAYQPLDDFADGVISIFSDRMDQNPQREQGSVRQMLARMRWYIRRESLIELTNPEAEVEWDMHSSAYILPGSQNDQDRLRRLLRNLEGQTSLKFELTETERKGYRVVEKGKEGG